MRIAYLDCFAGIAGDMFLGALIAAGVPESVLQDATSALNLGASLQLETVDRSGISSVKVHVLENGTQAEAHPHPHKHIHANGRSFNEIRSLINGSALNDSVKAFAIKTFDLLGNAEAKIHNVPVDSVHFHEVGAIDAIVDIVAAGAGAHHLQIDAWYASAINVGGGMIQCAHGTFPVPAPAAADLLRGFPTYSAHVQKELVTPTGAAILRALQPAFGPQPAMMTSTVGYGAGTRNPANFPNVLRLNLGQSIKSHLHQDESVTVLETSLDDLSPQLIAHVAEKALSLGALDVMLTPVIMKKGRPGTLLTLLCNPADSSRFEQLLLTETTTLGIRIRQDHRITLHRTQVSVDTAYGHIRMKIGSQDSKEFNAAPEYEDCKSAAAAHNVPLKQVQQAAIVAYRNRTGA